MTTASVVTEPHPPACEDCGTPHDLDGAWHPACSCPLEPWEVGLTYGGSVPYGVDYQSETGCIVCSLESRPVPEPWAVRSRFDRSDRCLQHLVTLEDFGGAA
jgi:hypothetical protein